MNGAADKRRRIYLDNNASTPVSEPALAAMMPYFREEYGNPSSIHAMGQRARAGVESAREEIATVLDCRPAEIVFTSGATESINAAIRGAVDAQPGKKRIVTSQVEHSATLDVCQRLAERGYEIVHLPVEPDGTLPIERVEEALTPETALLSLLWVNNETGVWFDVEAIGAAARKRGVAFHVDAAQLAGKGLTGLRSAPVDLLSFGAQKFGGPKGIGALYMARSSRVRPLLWGGHHEKGRRGGTENVPGIIAMAAALRHADAQWAARRGTVGVLRDRLAEGIREGVADVLVNGAAARRIENTLNVCFRNIEGAAIVLTLTNRGIDVSSGSACNASQPGPSHVLSAMKVPSDYVHGAVRFSLSSSTTAEEIETVIPEVVAAYQHVARVNLV